ncbi:MAG: hypothetical protein IJ563_10880 [Selenomonadaceae bacterium]|nr:hypothetical protein [Selenomonadaceae bacterium]
MRLLISLVVYFVFVYLGTDILGLLGFDIGDDYGVSQFTGKMNISISGVIVSSIIGFIAATALIILDEDERGFAIAIFFWLYQIYGDYSEMTKFIGWIGFFLLTLDNIIMLATLVAVNSIKDNLRSFFRNLKRDSDDFPPPEL